MDTNKILVSGLVGGVVYFLLGFLLYGMLFADFFAKNMGSASGVEKDPINFPALIIGNLVMGLLLAVIFGRWAGIKTMSTGAVAGAVIGLLFALGDGLTMFGTTNIYTATALVADIVIVTIMMAATGAAVGMMLGRGK